MNSLKVTLVGTKELKDEKGRGLDEGKHDIWCRTTLDSTGQSIESDVIKKCDSCWSGTTFNKKMSLCVLLSVTAGGCRLFLAEGLPSGQLP